MLPLELLKVIFGALSRDDLDALMLTNILFRDIVLRDFARDHCRYFTTLCVYAHRSYVFKLSTGNNYRCEDNDDFSRRMRLAGVGTLEYSCAQFNESMFNVMLPVKDAWRSGCIYTPFSFASHSLFERAFRELLFCKEMVVVCTVDGQLSQPLLSFPAVRECTSLRVIRAPNPLIVTEILGWLNEDARSKEPKRLDVDHCELGDSVKNLVQQLMTDFNGSTKARRYVVRIDRVHGYDGPSGRFVNRGTSEMLIIRFYKTDNMVHRVGVEREPLG